MKPTIWHGCYDVGWKGFITPASFAHPAKMSRGLLERIIRHGFDRGYWQRGSIIGDCFGGVGTTGIIGSYNGLNVVSVELEPKFVGLARDNFELHRSKLAMMGLPFPRIIQGDSRAFHVLIGATDAMVSSPPYAETAVEKHSSGVDMRKNFETYKASGGGSDFEGYKAIQEKHSQGYGKSNGQIAALKEGSVSGVISSPPYAVISTGAGGLNTKPPKHAGQQSGRSAKAASQDTDQKYGQTEGQIAALKEGLVSAVVSSPPYVDTTRGNDACGIDWDKAAPTKKTSGRHQAPGASASTEYGNAAGQIGTLKSGSVDGVVSLPPFREARSDTEKSHPTKHGGPCAERHHTTQAGAGYGDESGQIDNLPTGDVHAVVTSPPYEGSNQDYKSGWSYLDQEKMAVSSHIRPSKMQEANYGDSPGQIGKESGETYWQAMDAVYRSCFQAIKPGGVIVLVVKDYCKAGKRVPLCDDTVRLIEHIGFTMIERIHAMLVKETRHGDLFNGETKSTVSRKSFFRRLAEKKGSPAIDYEEVLIARRP